MNKVLGVRYPSSVDRVKQDLSHLQHIYEIEVENIKERVVELLFNDNQLYRYNYCLVNFKNKLFVMEPVDFATRTYVRREVTIHPLQHLVS